MPKVRIIRSSGGQDDDIELREVLKSADCELADEGEARESEEDEVMVVVLTPNFENDTNMDKLCMEAANSGYRVIGIWPKGDATHYVPRSFEKYGYDTVPWDKESIRATICGDDPKWLTPEGLPRPQPTTPRNKC